MSLEDTINNHIKDAILSKNKVELETLRAVKSAILLAKTETGMKGQLTEQTELKILQKLYKQRKESSIIFQQQNRLDLANVEIEQADVIKNYLPEQISEEELITIIKEIVQETGAISMADMGLVMSIATKKLVGKTDGKTISTIVQSLLS